MDSLQQILCIDGGVNPVFSHHGNGNHGHFFGIHGGAIATHLPEFPAPGRPGISPRQHRRLQETVGVDPHIELPALGIVAWCRDRLTIDPVLVPGVTAIDHKRLPHFFLNRRSTFPAQAIFPGSRIITRFPVEALQHGALLPVHHPGVIAQRFTSGPIHLVSIQALLTHHTGIGTTGYTDAVQPITTDGVGGCP